MRLFYVSPTQPRNTPLTSSKPIVLFEYGFALSLHQAVSPATYIHDGFALNYIHDGLARQLICPGSFPTMHHLRDSFLHHCVFHVLYTLKLTQVYPYKQIISYEIFHTLHTDIPSQWHTTVTLHDFRSSLTAILGLSVSYLTHRGLAYPCARTQYRMPSSASLSVSYQTAEGRQVVPDLMFHYAWDWLDTTDRVHLITAHPIMYDYEQLRHTASLLTHDIIRTLRQPLDCHNPPSTIDRDRVRNLGCVLLMCDFNVGGFIRFLGQHYTGDYLDYDSIDGAIATLRDIPHIPGEPIHNFDKTQHLFHHGFPQVANYACNRSDTLRRNLYDNHSSITPHIQTVLEKVATDVNKSYAIALPRWLFRFVDGLHLNPIGLLLREVNGKTKARIINDPATLVNGPFDTGAVNVQMDRKNHEDVPPVFYQAAQQRIWQRAYNLRIAAPEADIIVYKDDLVSAFRRVRYHPDVVSAYAYVLEELLLIPIGALFGPRNSPGWFSGTSELRAYASQHLPSLQVQRSSLIDQVTFSDDGPTSTLAPAFADSLNTGVSLDGPGPQPCFVDDTVMIELRKYIRQAATASVLSANLFFGCPSVVESPISMEKFMQYFTPTAEALGLQIDTRKMVVIYPDNKRKKFLDLLSGDWSTNSVHKVRFLAQILGILRHISQVIPLGIFLSLQLQLFLNQYIKEKVGSTKDLAVFRRRITNAWDKYRTVHIPPVIAANISLLKKLLSIDCIHVWSRPIGLLIPRDPHFTLLSDASTKGLGGFSFELKFQWRLSSDFFTISHTDSTASTDPHINILEFIGIIITIYLALLRLQDRSIQATLAPSDGHILLALADNTSALSWMRHATRSHSPPVRNLALFLTHLLFYANTIFPCNFPCNHIRGIYNIQADALSRPELHPTYNDVFTACSDLRILPAYRLPQKLIRMLNSCLSHRLIPEPSAKEMNALLAVPVHSLQLTATDWVSQTIASKTRIQET